MVWTQVDGLRGARFGCAGCSPAACIGRALRLHERCPVSTDAAPAPFHNLPALREPSSLPPSGTAPVEERLRAPGRERFAPRPAA